MRFTSKIDAWLVLTLAIALASVGYALVVSVLSGNAAAVAVMVGSVLLCVVPVIWMFFSTYYEVGSDALEIVAGPFRWQVPLDEIERVRASRSLLSSPALSLDRLEITHSGGRRVLVSPKDKAAFQAALARRA
ncbi:MAG: PH domain-containing protein [Acidobacteriota bacterium]